METEPSKVIPPKRKRCWFQFSLRSLMILTLMGAVASAWVARSMERKRKERDTVAAISKYGGRAFYYWQFDADFKMIDPQANPSGPAWFRSLVIDNIVCDVAAVDFMSTVDISEGLDELVGLPKLRKLDLSFNWVSIAGLEKLKRLTQLEDMWLPRNSVTDAQAKDVQRALPNCRVHRM
jgi:hypothetical protein